MMIIHSLVSLKRSSNARYIDSDDLLFPGIIDRMEVKRILVLAVVDIWAEVHQALEQACAATVSRVVADGPWIGVDFVHLVCGDSAKSALLDDLGVFATRLFDFEQFFDNELQGRHQLAMLSMG